MGVINASSGIKAGTVAHFAASTAPTGWLKANGAAISRSAYAALFAAIGTSYGAGDGSTTFNVPDLRGEFVRSLDDGRGVDSGRGIGSFQSHQIQTHNHQLNGNAYGSGAQENGAPSALDDWNTRGMIRWTHNAGGNETRPRNVAMLACIKY